MIDIKNILPIFINRAKTLRDFILNLIFPIECLGCSRPDHYLCDNCYKKLKINKKSYCLHCYQKNKFGEFCVKCKNKFLLNGVWIAGDYEQKLLTSLIKSLKYNFNKNIDLYLGNYLSLFLKNMLNKHRFGADNIKNFLKPEIFHNTPDLLYALTVYLTGDSGANTVIIRGVSDTK